MSSAKSSSSIHDLVYLPVFYLFPQELLNASEFARFPRNPHVVLNSPKWLRVYHSGKFTETIIDGMANMVWKHLGIKASMETFSGYYPFWILARMGVWIDIAAKLGFNTGTMANSTTFEYPVLPQETTENIFNHFVEVFCKEHPLDDWIETVKQYPAHDDYEPSRWRKAKIDFYRKWNHSCAMTEVTFVEDANGWDKLEKAATKPWKNVNFLMDYEEFKQTISEKDIKVMELLICGYSQKEIASYMGYANHSPVSKRAKRIGLKYRAFMAEDIGEIKEISPVKDNWDEMAQLLFPESKQIEIR